MPRIFLTPSTLLRALSAGAPKLHDVIAEAMTVTGEDPEIEILRTTSSVAPPRWSVDVRAGEYARHLPLDAGNEVAMLAAISLFLVELVQELRAELPEIMDRPEVVDALIGLLRHSEGAPGVGGGQRPS